MQRGGTPLHSGSSIWAGYREAAFPSVDSRWRCWGRSQVGAGSWWANLPLPYGHVQPLEEQFGRKNLSFKVSHSRAQALNWAPLPLVKKKKKISIIEKGNSLLRCVINLTLSF